MKTKTQQNRTNLTQTTSCNTTLTPNSLQAANVILTNNTSNVGIGTTTPSYQWYTDSYKSVHTTLSDDFITYLRTMGITVDRLSNKAKIKIKYETEVDVSDLMQEKSIKNIFDNIKKAIDADIDCKKVLEHLVKRPEEMLKDIEIIKIVPEPTDIHLTAKYNGLDNSWSYNTADKGPTFTSA